MPRGHVLVVDDEPLQRRYYARLLTDRGYATRTATNGAEAFAEFKSRPPSLALIDVGMPDIDGLTLYKALQTRQEAAGVPILLLTGLNVPTSVLEAASIGLDSEHIFLKGREEARLISRIAQYMATSINGRKAEHAQGALLTRRISVDQFQRRVWIDGREIQPLATRRYDLLSLLIRANGPLSREAILKSVWPENENRNTVDVTIRRLRRDLADFPGVKILTTSNGYRLLLDG